ncbi:hypothetical protein KAF25_001352 [Fusarium avenaceum]|uniref:AAA+ ATPase domain-containing protein n=1 Tax=Fusarium avenaceum TaxID=40199 RepID=A0A9P7KRR0_9HYPO|nr:hypothetical protein KAF25_001352 [Fusarium avenaceum]
MSSNSPQEAKTSALRSAFHIDMKRKDDAQTLKQSAKIGRVDQVYSRKDRQIHLFKTSKRDRKRRDLQKHTLVVRRIISAKGLPTDLKIDICSPKLAVALKQILQGVEGLDIASGVKSPEISPNALFWAWDGLSSCHERELEKPEPDSQLVEDLSVALEYLETDHGSIKKELEGLLADNLINYDLLEKLFKPNDTLYSQHNLLKEIQAFRLVSSRYHEDEEHGKHYEVNARFISHDGERLGWARKTFCLLIFEGNTKITDLDIFPSIQHPERTSIKADLKRRGLQFMELVQKPVCQWYDSTAVYQELVGPKYQEVKFMASKRVMIDPVRFGVHNNSWHHLRRPEVNDAINPLIQLTDEDLLCCCHRILGFSFEEKKWGAFAVSKLQGTVWNMTAFDKVALPSKQLRLIKDLVRSHRVQTCNEDNGSEEQGDDDIIKGKGQGLVGLLSGNPGVGKTLTAEAVAELSNRPLYAISAGELGTDIPIIDQKLGQILNITRCWNCVLLIDEVDVFLHRRGTDLKRNAVVSVFLRRMEYFQGVAILTTNRKLDIDPAFMSRIHFQVHYRDLEYDAILQIWRTFLGKEISARGSDITDDDLQRLAKEYKLSGREIKNAAFCAKSISRTREEPLSFQLVKDLIDNLGYTNKYKRQNERSRLQRKFAKVIGREFRERKKKKVSKSKAKQVRRTGKF